MCSEPQYKHSDQPVHFIFISRTTSPKFLSRARRNKKYFQYLLTKNIKTKFKAEKILLNSTLVPQNISQNKSLQKSLIPIYEFSKHSVFSPKRIISQSIPIYNIQLISGKSSQRYPYANLSPFYIIKNPSRSFWTLLEMEPTRTNSYIPALIKNIPNVL